MGLQVCRNKCDDCQTMINAVPELIDSFPSDDLAGEGDLKDSQSMINHTLLKATRDCDLDAVNIALARGAHLETRRPFVISPEASLKQGSRRRGKGLTPLMYAAHGSADQIVVRLLEARACVNAEDEEGIGPLHLAASTGDAETCKVLLDAGAEVDAEDDHGKRPFDHLPTSQLTTPGERRFWEDLFKPRPPDSDEEMDMVTD
mmetsp:Transcript_60630/g.131417  ORF Transcript_60630/g.131417 Transcript_60630/m.131417 type:complete len:203 (-) Transcript_60630:106-714(-)